jgi:hypothetical protein
VLGLKRGKLLRAARREAKPTRAAAAAETRRRGRTTRRRDSAKAEKSGDGFRALRRVWTATSNEGGFLTSRRRTWTASRRRDSGGGGESTVAVARVSGGSRCRQRRRLREGPGGTHGLNSLGWPVLDVRAKGTHACASRTRRWCSARPSPARARRVGGDDKWDLAVSDRGGGGEWLRWAGGVIGPKGQAGRGNGWEMAAAACWAEAASWAGWWPLRAGLGKGRE